MAQPSTSVTNALPLVGLLALTLPGEGPSICIREMHPNGYIVAYDRETWSRDLIDRYVRMYFGDYQLVEAPAEGGA